MKTFLLAALVMAIGTEPAEAKCGCGADVLTATVVEGQPSIVVETSCAVKDPKVALEDAAGKPVAITMTATYDGYSNTAQYVFQPDRALAPGSYKVVLANRSGASKHVLAVVAAQAAASPPVWSGGPSVLDQRQMEYGCGPAKKVNVRAGATASLAYVELTDNGSKQRSSGYVRVQNGALAIGHGMCSGAFSLMKTRGYTATITLLAPELGTSSMAKTMTFNFSP